MGSIFQAGEAMQLAAYGYAAEPVDYLRGGSVIAKAIPAKMGKTVFRYSDHYGQTVREEQRDFIVRTSDLKIEPETGDEILFNGTRYLVAAPNGEPCWRWHSRSSNAQKRIHTKYNGTAAEK